MNWNTETGKRLVQSTQNAAPDGAKEGGLDSIQSQDITYTQRCAIPTQLSPMDRFDITLPNQSPDEKKKTQKGKKMFPIPQSTVLCAPYKEDSADPHLTLHQSPQN